MSMPLVRTLTRLVRRLRSWPRRFVLKATGEPVELIALHELDGRRRCVVELRGGRRIEVLERELASRPAGRSLALVGGVGLAVAGILASGPLVQLGARALADVAVCAQALSGRSTGH